MALHTKKDFAQLCNLPPKNLATYIGRKKVNVREDGMIDDKDQINKAFLSLRKSKVSEKDVIKHISKFADDNDYSIELPDDYHTAKLRALLEGSDEEDDGIPDLIKSTKLLKHLDTKKREREIQLLQLREEKLKGQMVPSDLIQPVILQHNQSMITEFKNAGDNFLRVFSQKKSMSGEEMAEVKGEFTRIINQAVTNATEMSIKSIEAIINNFAETRTKGERR